MSQPITEAHLVAYLYNETTPQLTSQIQDILLTDDKMLTTYLELAESKTLLSSVRYNVPDYLIDGLLFNGDMLVG